METHFSGSFVIERGWCFLLGRSSLYFFQMSNQYEKIILLLRWKRNLDFVAGAVPGLENSSPILSAAKASVPVEKFSLERILVS